MTYDTQKPHTLDAHRVALEAAALILHIVGSTPRKLSELEDRLTRSAVSVAANLAEGAGRAGRDRSYHWRIAYGSALESRSHLELLKLAGAINAQQASKALELLDRVSAMTWRLLHPKRWNAKRYGGLRVAVSVTASVAGARCVGISSAPPELLPLPLKLTLPTAHCR